MSDFLPLAVPHIKGRAWEYVKECLDSEWVSSAGPFVDRFEEAFAREVGAKYAVACSSGTAALHISLLLAEVKPGDIVLVPTLTFIASVNAIRYCGAEPVFFDADEFYNMEPEGVKNFLETSCEKREGGCYHRASGKRIAAILPVHVFGNAAKISSLLALAQEKNIPIVEDAAESLGTRYLSPEGKKSTGTFGLMGAFSFNGNKIITTGGGGMIVTEEEALAKKARYLTTQAKDDEVRFVHNEVGFNYRMTNIQAALGLSQLECLEEFLQTKKSHFHFYQEALASLPGFGLAPVPPYAENNHWLPALQIDPSGPYDRESLIAKFQKAGIQTRPIWLPNHLQKPFQNFLCHGSKKADRLWKITLNLPASTGTPPAQLKRVVDVLKCIS